MTMSDDQLAVQLVCFDIGGVLIRIVDDWHDAFRLAGLNLPDAAGNGDGEAAFRAAARAYETGRIDDAAFLAAMTQRLGGLTTDQARAIMSSWLIEPFEGVAQVIELVNATTAVTACLSNTNLLHWRQMEADARYGPMLRKLDQHFTSFDMGARKPEPAIYEQVEQVMGLPGQRILFFDDLEKNVAAARGRGWRAERIDPRGDPAAQMRRCLVELGVVR